MDSPIRSPMRKLKFISQKWNQGIGEICIGCKSKLIPSQVISLCKCHLYCHEKCFINEFKKHLKRNQSIYCISCSEQIKIKFKFKTKWVCSKSRTFIAVLSLYFLTLITFFALVLKGFFKTILSDEAAYLIFAFLLLILIITLILSSKKQELDFDSMTCQNTNVMQSQIIGSDKQISSSKSIINPETNSSTFKIESETL